ncbi:MAG: hypothetical protein CM1200mP18_18520 [Gammaproteobacteria bacterium]|nr:MAG: hypothetical protein CM1200mP18_18520 [Gammaproteobacteria bacterium]
MMPQALHQIPPAGSPQRQNLGPKLVKSIQGRTPERLPKTLLIAHDAFAFSEDAVQTALAPTVKRLSELFEKSPK